MKQSSRRLPEDIELERKLAELAAKEALLAERELALAILRSDLMHFERLYMEKVGRVYVQLDEVEAERARRRAKANPAYREQAEELRQQAETSRREYQQTMADATAAAPAVQTPELKALYRSLAKKFHPDMALDPTTKAQRSGLMARINELYAKGDVEGLMRLEAEVESAPDAVFGDDTAAKLIRTIRKIAQIDARLAEIDEEIASLQGSEMNQLREQWLDARNRGQDLLASLAEDVERRIREAKRATGV